MYYAERNHVYKICSLFDDEHIRMKKVIYDFATYNHVKHLKTWEIYVLKKEDIKYLESLNLSKKDVEMIKEFFRKTEDLARQEEEREIKEMERWYSECFEKQKR